MPGLRWVMLISLVLLQPGCVLFDAARVTGTKPPPDAGLLPPAESARACMAVADNLARQGHLDLAVQKLLEAREFDAQADVGPALARLYARLGNDRLARDEFAQALEI